MKLELTCFEILHKKMSKQRFREKEMKRVRERGIEEMFVIEIWEDPLEKGMATHSSILSWSIPWTEEPDRLQSMGSQSRTCLSN